MLAMMASAEVVQAAPSLSGAPAWSTAHVSASQRVTQSRSQSRACPLPVSKECPAAARMPSQNSGYAAWCKCRQWYSTAPELFGVWMRLQAGEKASSIMACQTRPSAIEKYACGGSRNSNVVFASVRFENKQIAAVIQRVPAE